MNSLVTYIIPSYNHAQYIEQAIESVLAQTYSPIELIIVDDGSQDNTREVLDKYEEHDAITIVYNEVNLRQGATLNKALSIAKGDFVGFLPSDDWLLPEKTKLQIQKFAECVDDVGVIYGRGARFFAAKGGDDELTVYTPVPSIKGRITKDLILKGNFIYPVTPLFKSVCFTDTKFDESYTAEGEAIYLKVSLKYKFDFVEEIVGVMRDHQYNTGKKTFLMYEENFRYREEFMAREDVPEDIKRLRGIWLGMLSKTKAMELIVSHKKFGQGRKLAFEAISYNPGYLRNPRFLLAIAVSFFPDRFAAWLLSSFYSHRKKI